MLFALLAAFIVGTEMPLVAQTNPPLSVLCLFDDFTIRGDASYFNDWNIPLSAAFFFGPGDVRNGTHVSSDMYGTGNVRRIIFASIPCNGQREEKMTCVMTLTTKSGQKKNYIFIDGNYCPACTSIRKCPASVECSASQLTLQFDYALPCPLGSNPDLTFYFGPGHPFNDFQPSAVSCVAGPPGVLKLVRNLSCYGDCPDISKLRSLTIDGAVCLYENGKLVTEPVCPPEVPYTNGSTSGVCNAFFNNCLGAYNDFLFEHRGELGCRQWKQSTSRCDLDLWAGRTGKVGIGSVKTTNYALSVKDGIITDHLRVQTCATGGWCDYVFEPEYRLMPLDLLGDYLEAHRHLPGTPSAAQVEDAEGYMVKAVILNHQEKIEEVFLHLIALQKEADRLQAEYARLLEENAALRKN